MSQPRDSDANQKDFFEAYAVALVIAIVLTLALAAFLHIVECVPKHFFPRTVQGWTAVALVIVACILSFVARGFKPAIWAGHGTIWRPNVQIKSGRRGRLKVIILLASVSSLLLLMLTSGGVTGPYNAYLGTFPIVVSILFSSRLFAIVTFALTLGVYVAAICFATPITPNPGHEFHYNAASIATFGASLAFTSFLIVNEKRFDASGEQSGPAGEGAGGSTLMSDAAGAGSD